MSTRASPNYEYADNPVYFRQLYDDLGKHQLADLLGYTVTSLASMYSGSKQVRKFVEFACQQYIENQDKRENEERIYFFVSKLDSEAFKTLSSVAKAVGIKITLI